MNFRTVGYIRRTHGLEGRLQIIVNDLDSDFVCSLKSVFYGHSDQAPEQVLDIREIRPHRDGYLLLAEGIDSISDAEQLLKCSLFLPEGDLPLHTENESLPDYADWVLLDCDDATPLGHVREKQSWPAQDILICAGPDGKEFMIPFVDEFVRRSDAENQRLYVKLIPGLNDEA